MLPNAAISTSVGTTTWRQGKEVIERREDERKEKTMDAVAADLGVEPESLIGGLDLPTAARLLGIGVSTLRQRALAGKIGHARDGRRWVFAWRDLAEYLDARHRPAMENRRARRSAMLANAQSDDGDVAGGGDLPRRDPGVALEAESFLGVFPVVDEISEQPIYREDFSLATPGYNSGKAGWRIFYGGSPVEVADGFEATNRLFDVMHWKSAADRANALALKLTVALRNHWCGGKPMGAILANKSHAGKDTIADYATGSVAQNEIDWETADWSVRNNFEEATRDPAVGVVRVGNVRARGGAMASAFLERFLTNRRPLITSSRIRDGRVVENRIVLMVTTNDGALSEDLLNRSLVIRLEARGDVRNRRPEIGNPREDYIPAHEAEMEAEIHNMIARWRKQGCPLDTDVRHPMTGWARTVGGILQANGIEGFLGNADEALSMQEDERTVFLLNLALHWMKEAEGPVIFISLEMPLTHVLLKLLAIQVGQRTWPGLASYEILDYLRDGIHTKSMWPSDPQVIDGAIVDLRGWESRLWPIYAPGASVDLIAALCRQVFEQCNASGPVVIDYCQLISGGEHRFERRDIEVARTCAVLKALAASEHCPIVMGAQINREGVSASTVPAGAIDDPKVREALRKRRPQIHQLRECDVIGQQSDRVLGLQYLVEDYAGAQPLNAVQTNKPERGPLEVVVLKSRFGSASAFELTFRGRSGAIVDRPVAKNIKTIVEEQQGEKKENDAD